MMTEKEKMLAGKPYFANDDALVADRLAAKELFHRFNSLKPSEIGAQRRVLCQLLGATKENFIIEAPFRCDYGYNVSIGENFYSNFNLLILDGAPVTIGDNAFIAPNVSIFTAGHPLHPELRNQQWEYAFPVVIGNNVWIGGNVVINPSVTIGDNSVIGSGSVVTQTIPDNVLAVGNPCRTVRKITEEDRRYYFKKLPFE